MNVKIGITECKTISGANAANSATTNNNLFCTCGDGEDLIVATTISVLTELESNCAFSDFKALIILTIVTANVSCVYKTGKPASPPRVSKSDSRLNSALNKVVEGFKVTSDWSKVSKITVIFCKWFSAILANSPVFNACLAEADDLLLLFGTPGSSFG